MKSKTLLICFLLLCSCNNRSDKTVAVFQIKTEKHTNGGTPFYIVAKPTDYMNYVCDDYKKIYRELAKASGEMGPIKTFFMIPGETKVIRMETKENMNPAVYFLFTNPGEAWSYFSSGKGEQSVKILLGEREIESQSVFRS